jgi:predicted pyridoxine 5'-phosphate oxidase superfamily flavin-nucleotide-binding protein
MTDVRRSEAVRVPASHRDLLARTVCGVLTTMDAEGQPESSLVRVDVDEEGQALVNTTLERRKSDLAANPKVSLLVVDPENTARFIQVRGDAELRSRGTRVICRIHARRITLDAIHT